MSRSSLQTTKNSLPGRAPARQTLVETECVSVYCTSAL
jgi:hypothetical protein